MAVIKRFKSRLQILGKKKNWKMLVILKFIFQFHVKRASAHFWQILSNL